MRTKLKESEGKRETFIGHYDSQSRKAGYNGQAITVLIKDIRRLSGELVADHTWFNYTKGFAAIYLTQGDRIRFTARSKVYYKGPKKRRADYHLTRPAKIEKVLPGSGPRFEFTAALHDSGAEGDLEALVALFAEQHAPTLQDVHPAWFSQFDYAIHNREALAEIIAAYQEKDFGRYVLLHDPYGRVDALLALRQVSGFHGHEYWNTVRKLKEDGADRRRPDAWAILHTSRRSGRLAHGSLMLRGTSARPRARYAQTASRRDKRDTTRREPRRQ